MMNPLRETFTPNELATLAKCLGRYVDDYEGVDSPEEIQEARDLQDTITRRSLIGKKVRFLHKGEELRGELLGYKDWEGILMAEIARNGSRYLVGAERCLLGKAP